MSRLILLPEIPGHRSGYEIAVRSDLERISLRQDDDVIVYTNEMSSPFKGAVRLKRPDKFSFTRLLRILKGVPSLECSGRDLKLFPERDYSVIFCGDSIFYRSARYLFPDKLIIVRLHNCYSLSRVRSQARNIKLNLLYRINQAAFQKLEREIFADDQAIPILITEEEYRFFKLLYPMKHAYYWSVVKEYEEVVASNSLNVTKNIVWFGGLSSHKKQSVLYFIREVYPVLREKSPDIQFHLFGKGADKLNDPANMIFGHGYHEGESLPMQGLYINPDLVGGGVKVKLEKLIREKMPFITTPYGGEGYDLKLCSNCYIAEMEDWSDVILAILDRSKGN